MYIYYFALVDTYKIVTLTCYD